MLTPALAGSLYQAPRHLIPFLWQQTQICRVAVEDEHARCNQRGSAYARTASAGRRRAQELCGHRHRTVQKLKDATQCYSAAQLSNHALRTTRKPKPAFSRFASPSRTDKLASERPPIRRQKQP